ncbi:L,D-transpeptidase family protein [Phenylobacterium sp.]|uniref:L,D-transpeptidase family protein n=1 Tax=Phenylobacterium sp. TaxID=1871053 RepID=UPI002B5A93C8|nr:L,D-transpeptidase family protein [Phenylobacterium sp.]HLZ75791.1 L,D-transpeptidase family protein [Phenylobacterium sp.]
MTATRAPAHSPLLSAILAASAVLALSACAPHSAAVRLAREDAVYATQVLDRAPQQGFAPGSFHIGEIHAAEARRDPAASALLREGVIEYARAQHGLSLPARARPAAWGEAPAPYDAAAELDAALARRQFRAWLDAQPPPSPIYHDLQQAYAAILAHPQATQPQATQPAAAQAGAVTPALLRANLERLRWLPREEPATRVDVNIASATLIYVVDGQAKLTMRTASGKPGDETPMLTSKIDSIVLNPPWNVPANIAAAELMPKGEDYLAAHGFVASETGGLVQNPGPESALGLVKFDFANPYSVYLHDTPSKAAFDKAGRAVSHGCVRLERAMDLANLLLAQEPGWSPQRVADTVATQQTTTVKLHAPVAVRLLYLTAVPSGGRIAVLPDVYGWDAALLRLMDQGAGAKA